MFLIFRYLFDCNLTSIADNREYSRLSGVDSINTNTSQVDVQPVA